MIRNPDNMVMSQVGSMLEAPLASPYLRNLDMDRVVVVW